MGYSQNIKQLKWDLNLSAVKRFAEKNRRWPSTYAKDEEEKSLGKWWSKTKHYATAETYEGTPYRISYENAEQVKELVSLYPHFDRKGLWAYRFRQIELRILSKRRLWKAKEATPKQMKLMYWWREQKVYLRRYKEGWVTNGMNEERAAFMDWLIPFENKPEYRKKHR